MGIDFYKVLDSDGDVSRCPVCGCMSRWVMKCDGCGDIFCIFCKPQNFIADKPTKESIELSDVTVTCEECGEHTYFS